MVYDVTSEASLKKLPELHEKILEAFEGREEPPIVIAGNKADLEENRVISFNQGKKLAQDWGAKHFFETSAKARTNVDEVFQTLLDVVIEYLVLYPHTDDFDTEIIKSKKKKCTIM
eukprot:TRINITY_DN377_c0_g1_i1.p1 TRINITY_DN377_c0_g1~~TRINITY_DN377_c0_g1_i1.p1  ORF type:complete len:116 (+),score=29.48 TRINITY_DN377_c0_g1_i1:448-795(+)